MEWNQDVTLPEIHLYNHDCNTAPVLLTVEIQPVDYTIWDTAALTLLQRFLQVDTPIINRIVFFVMLQLFLYICSLQPTPAIIYQRYCMYWQILCTAVIRNVVHYTTAHVFHRRHITLHYITLLFHHRLPGQQSTAIFQIISAS